MSTLKQTVINPWNQQPVGEVEVSGAPQIAKAMKAAVAAFSTVRHQPAWERAGVLNRVADLLVQRRNAFASTIVAEAGKPVAFAEAEVDRAASTFRLAAALSTCDNGHGLTMDAVPQGIAHRGFVGRFPLGVILGISPFNFPLNLVAHKVAPCIATGNVMLLKPAMKTPLTALLLARVLEHAGVPEGQITVLCFGHEHVGTLLTDDRVRMLSFTGGVEVGWNLKTLAKKQKVALELGGNAAVIVEPESDWQAAIPKIATAAFGYAGQSCISVQRILVHSSILSEFRESFISHVDAKIPVGDPSDRTTVVGPMISAEARDKVVAWIRDAESAGGILLRPLHTGGASMLGPAVIGDAPAESAVSCEEVFAPVATLGGYNDFEDAIHRVNSSRFGLQAGVFTPDINKALHAYENLEVGGVMINEVPTFRTENMPYGGVKDSGFGREGVRYAMEEMTDLRSLVIAAR